MRTVQRVVAIASLVLFGLSAGCQPSAAQIEAMMKPQPRPAELDHLDAFIGKWQGTGEFTMAGMEKTMSGAGSATYSWDADKRVLVEKGEWSMGEDSEDKYVGTGMWVWDAPAKTFRVWGFNNHGGMEWGTASYDEETRTWRFKSKSRNLVSGQSMAGEGTLKLIDNNTIEWDFTGWDSWKLTKLMEGKGVSRRQ